MKISHSRLQSYRAPQAPGKEGSAQVFKATSDEAETQARHSIVQGELHFGRRDLGRTCLAAGACSTTTGGETAALLPLMAMCRTPRALTSTHRRGVVRSRNQRGVARTGQERSAGAREALRAIPNTKRPARTRQKKTTKTTGHRNGGERRRTQEAPAEEAAHRGLNSCQSFLGRTLIQRFYICEDSQTTASWSATTGGCPPMLKLFMIGNQNQKSRACLLDRVDEPQGG